MTSPYLSFVLASRNDDHAGNMRHRLQICLNNLVEQVEKYKLPSELLLVDWNPPADRPLLKDALSRPSNSNFCNIRVIEVPQSLHQKLKFSKNIPFLVHTAWNVGIRRARGKFILSLSNDIMLSKEVIQFFSKQDLDEENIYRINRHDIPENTLDLGTLSERLKFAKSNVLRTHDLEGAMRIPGHDIRMHTNAAGDFLLMSKRFWVNLRGLPEERDFHSGKFDGLLCYMAHAAGATQQILPDPMRAYHVSHGVSDWKPVDNSIVKTVQSMGLVKYFIPSIVREIAKQKLFKPKSKVGRWGIPQITKSQYRIMAAEILDRVRPFTYNGKDWGLGDRYLQESVL